MSLKGVPERDTPSWGLNHVIDVERRRRSNTAGTSVEVLSGAPVKELSDFAVRSIDCRGVAPPPVAANAKVPKELKWLSPGRKDIEVLHRALTVAYQATDLLTWIKSLCRDKKRKFLPILFSKIDNIVRCYKKHPHGCIGNLKGFAFHCREISFAQVF